MDRYVFYHPDSLDKKVLAAAKGTAVLLGAKVIRTAVGSMLVEASPAKVAQVAEALPDWRWCREAAIHRIPERGRLHRPPTK